MKILFVSPEAMPYYKSGGLADVARSLPDALSRLGHTVRVFHPLYSCVERARFRFRRDEPLTVPWVGGNIALPLYVHERPGSATAVLPAHAAFSVGESPYQDPDPSMTGRRFGLFSRAALHYAAAWGADVVHLNDWQTGLVAAYALSEGITIPTLFTIHNVAYQGLFMPSITDEIGLPRELYRTENGVEFYGHVSFLKAGVALASRITTVSHGYAREIQTPEFGAGFDGLLRFRSRDLFGILNGIDVDSWNPATDRALERTYDAGSLHEKDALRSSFMRAAGLETTRPLFVVISRFAYQKGIDVVIAALPELLETGACLFVLGEGDDALEAQLAAIARAEPGRVAAVNRFNDQLARKLYASADFLVMPSRYEPCGLGQMIAQRYGTPPVVRATGGLRDTVRDGVTGFCFERAAVHDLVAAVRRAVAVWRGSEWDDLRRRCMAQDWSWRTSARRYLEAYTSARGAPSS